MGGKNRKPGEWRAVMEGRKKVERELHHGQGLSNIPRINDVGSAAYRRANETTKGKKKS